ncbi:uncharacterized protein [Misgurnus anguillicaudatus]|uniref:uncharacterized protein n=1 Tax=Misgurnus anguillicaudatus TaxID=75329 RepID=UPI003CCF961D
MEHNYALLSAAGSGGKDSPRKRKRTGQPNDPRRVWDKRRERARINIGVAFSRWRELRDKLQLERDADLACVLLDSYQKSGPSTSTPYKGPGMPLQTLSSIASSIDSLSDRDQCFLEPGIEHLSMAESDEQLLHDSFSKMSFHDESTITVNEDANDLHNTVIDFRDPNGSTSGKESDDSTSDEDYVPSICLRTGEGTKDFRKIEELHVIGLEETVHLPPEDEVPFLCEQHVPTSSASHKVMCEDDIIGQRASIVYEAKLKQLVTHLQLPVLKCNFINKITKETCQASPPFEVHLTSRGTATVLQWICFLILMYIQLKK